MTELAFVICSVCVLCLPSAWWMRGRFHRVTMTQIAENATLRRGLFHPLALTDFARAWVGYWLLQKAVDQALPLGGNGHYLIVGFVGLTCALGLTLQMLFHRLQEIEVHPPFAYLAGLLVAALPPAVSIPALLLGFATALAARNALMGITLTGFSVLVLGFLMNLSKFTLASQVLLFGVVTAAIVGSNRYYAIPISRALFEKTRKKADRFSSRMR